MASYDVRYETLQKSIKEEKNHAKEIEKEKEYMQSDEYIAQVAREKLGLVKDNEIIFEEGNEKNKRENDGYICGWKGHILS